MATAGRTKEEVLADIYYFLDRAITDCDDLLENFTLTDFEEDNLASVADHMYNTMKSLKGEE